MNSIKEQNLKLPSALKAQAWAATGEIATTTGNTPHGQEVLRSHTSARVAGTLGRSSQCVKAVDPGVSSMSGLESLSH